MTSVLILIFFCLNVSIVHPLGITGLKLAKLVPVCSPCQKAGLYLYPLLLHLSLKICHALDKGLSNEAEYAFIAFNS